MLIRAALPFCFVVWQSDLAPSLQGVAKQLERQQMTDRVNRGLDDRPDEQSLIQSGIMKSPAIAPSLQNTARQLEKQQNMDAVKQALGTRPTEERLEHAGIIGGVC